jgi:hypothetical protein
VKLQIKESRPHLNKPTVALKSPSHVGCDNLEGSVELVICGRGRKCTNTNATKVGLDNREGLESPASGVCVHCPAAKHSAVQEMGSLQEAVRY